MKNKLVANAKILMVDDEPDFLDLFKDSLADHFTSIETATSGEEGLRIFKSQSFDVVVTDFSMPGMNGIEFIHQLRKIDQFVPILICSGRGRDPQVIAALGDLIFDVIEKPSPIDMVVNRVQNAILLPKLLRFAWSTLQQSMSQEQLDSFQKMSAEDKFNRIFAHMELTNLRSLKGA